LGCKKIKILVAYASRSGNTQKIAEAVSFELNCEAIKVTKETPENIVDLNLYDLIFIGTGIHYSNPNEDLMTYLKKAKLSSPKQVAFFITWGGAGKTNQAVLSQLKTLLQSKNQALIEKSFFCYGGWNLLRRGHPKADELRAARDWAKKIVNELSC
jgi:flavodoxin